MTLNKGLVFIAVIWQLLVASSCCAQQINIANTPAQFTAPYSILANTNYTAALNLYRYGDFSIEVIDRQMPDKVLFKIAKNADGKLVPHNINGYKLPWWSTAAPKILKQLDFSMVNGSKVEYIIATNYRLKLLSHQGNSGKVYVLEQLDVAGGRHIICAVKILLTKFYNQDEYFRLQHKTEIENNIIANNFAVAIKTYGIIENDPDHYLLFLEYGQSVKDVFAQQTLDQTLQQLDAFIQDLNAMYAAGYTHGDLNLGNLLYVGDQIKLCDWYSLTNIQQKLVGEYRYVGDNLPPEAPRAFYYDKILKDAKQQMQYAVVTDRNKPRAYWLHPIAADRFCLGISLMEIVAADLYKIIVSKPFIKGFNAYAPQSLDFWPEYAQMMQEIQLELLRRSSAIKDPDAIQAKMLHMLSEYIDIDPMQR